jgi:hypothetical protein
MTERIDLTPEALKEGFTDALYEELEKTLDQNSAWPDPSDIKLEVDEMLAVLENSGFLAELKRCYEELDEHDKLVGLLIENHFVETSPYETVKHLIETHQDYKTSE